MILNDELLVDTDSLNTEVETKPQVTLEPLKDAALSTLKTLEQSPHSAFYDDSSANFAESVPQQEKRETSTSKTTSENLTSEAASRKADPETWLSANKKIVGNALLASRATLGRI
ncbi:uncharacterized protein LOC142353989 [Convolutriloba macropyga]|uniref:uncharacterized protein LOC142353989 n=1 Tax=Convolutriloba macropyga TaxID=536237 RepID=UPI003F51CDEE